MKTFIISSFILTSISISGTELSFGYGDHNSPPYIEVGSKGGVSGGELYELAKFVSKELGVTFKMVHTPRSRLEELIKNGSIGLYCNSNKAWVSDADEFYWFESIFEDENVVYAISPKHKSIEKFDQIETPLGAIKGFSYHPEIEKTFKNVGRYNLKSHDNLIQFLERKRIEFIISSKNVLEYYFRKKEVKAFPVTSFRDKFTYDCVVSKKININKNKLFKSLEKFKALRESSDTAVKN